MFITHKKSAVHHNNHFHCFNYLIINDNLGSKETTKLN